MINLIYPTKVREIISPFGPRSLGDGFHDGVDFLCDIGTKVVSPNDGLVVKIGFSRAYGKYLIIQHDGYCTLIAHFSLITVKPGQKVNRGEKVGLSGNTGLSTVPHVHLEIRIGEYSDPDFWSKTDNKFNNSVDPEPYLSEPWKISALKWGEAEGYITPGIWHANKQVDMGTLMAVLQKKN